MGVPGLWDLLRPAATRTSLSALARESFYSNKNGLRALTIGIDASIWIFHAQIPQYGENPFLRTIFFKITSLLQQPVLPVFVFDGPNKPPRKRGEKVAGHFGTSDHRSKQFKELLDACGLEWWNAPGEAEAELAIMNRQGKIDAVLSDDVDALLFGATCLLRNNSPTLSGTQAASTHGGVAKVGQYEMYRSSSIVSQWTSKEGTSLKTEEDCRMAMVWIALLGGGDYAPEGLPGFGSTITYALANAGLASFLHSHKSGSSVNATDAARVHAQMIEELRTNATGHLGRRYKDRATKLADVEPSSLFPTGALDAYLRPATSPLHDPSQGWPGFGKGEPVYQRRGRARMEGRGDLDGFAKACERFFEWGTKDLVAKKFASESVGLFGSELVTCARERVRQADPVTSPVPAKQVDNKDSSPPLSTGRITSFFRSSASTRTRPTERRHSFENMPAHVHKIHSVRSDPTDAELNEYRVSFSTIEYIKRCHEVMDGHRVDPKELDTDSRAELGLVDKDTDIPPASQAAAIPVKEEARVWIPEYLIKEAWPELVDTYEAELAAKAKPKSKIKSKTTKSTKKAPSASGENTQAFKSFFLTQRPTVPPQPASSDVEEEEILEDLPPRMPSSRGSSRSFSTDSHNRRGPSSPLTSPPPLPATIKKNARPAPSSLSPSSSSAAPTEVPVTTTRTRSTTTITSKTSSTQASTAQTPSPRRNTRRVTRAKTKQTVECAVIDLCSSEDEIPYAPSPPKQALHEPNKANMSPSLSPNASSSRTILGPISKSNSPSPIVEPASKPKTNEDSKGKGKEKGKGKGKESDKSQSSKVKSSQTLLSMPIVRPMKEVAPVKAPAPITAPRAKAPLYVITYEDDETVEMDVRGRWARGESVGAWGDAA